jgi:hypothetical protein
MPREYARVSTSIDGHTMDTERPYRYQASERLSISISLSLFSAAFSCLTLSVYLFLVGRGFLKVLPDRSHVFCGGRIVTGRTPGVLAMNLLTILVITSLFYAFT